jgi:ankyrin repeat protein
MSFSHLSLELLGLILALLSKQDKIGWRLLHWSAFYGHERVVQQLLKKGADVAGRIDLDRQRCPGQL